ncbi:hypothetical protein [Tenacibaculum sp. IB213877]|uniref:HD domain-containing protein n=1 Tax=Tenacibaculum sp. IB213877 TaxID=3097351 RepID=UPI002A5AB3C1|nr:hypothetical protein [Tenacibaculum sp. IB213877]MDY0779498.1 hypothetical protein [Tenacibaculum sp. IB213877]
MKLKQRFFNLVSAYTKDQDLIDSLWKDISKHYSEKHRAYHNIQHITELFKYYDIYKEHIKKPDLLAFSIFYHDIIYNIWKKNNEEKSADFAVEKLSKLISSKNLNIIKNHIIATKAHHTEDNDTKWMIDFDLAILGQSSHTYKNYTQLIKEEYQLVPSIIYKKGRKKVLQHFLDKPFIYATELFRELYEMKARENLKNELINI